MCVLILDLCVSQVHYGSAEVPFLNFEEEEEEEEEEGGEGGSSILDDSQAIQGWVEPGGVVKLCCRVNRYSVENAYLEEKEDGCNALAEIAENVG